MQGCVLSTLVSLGPGRMLCAGPTAAALLALPARAPGLPAPHWFRVFSLTCFISELRHFFVPLGITHLCVLSSGFAALHVSTQCVNIF